MRRRWCRRATLSDPGDINITAFMNLMVILVPFLLITAVFSRITILELNLPAGQASTNPAEDRFALELIVRKESVEIGDRQGGLIKRIPNQESGYDLAQISELLQQIKSRYPDKQDVTLLLEGDIAYDSLVQMMDTVRMADTVVAGNLVKVELFPQISVGDAPLASEQIAAVGGK